MSRRYLLGFIGLLIVLVVLGSMRVYAHQVWEIRYVTFLNQVQENSIKNSEWNQEAWSKYRIQCMSLLPIYTQDQFNKAVTTALIDLGDHHSYLIPQQTSKTAAPSNESPKVHVVDGIGVIQMKGYHVFDVQNQQVILGESWVQDVQAQLDTHWKDVTKGWIIDLRQNDGGSMFPMIGALSRFFEMPDMGGYYFPQPPQPVAVKHRFDGQHFKANDEVYLSFSKAYPLNKNTLPVIVLIGKSTGSSGEFLAQYLKRQPKVTLMGDRTAGVASVNEGMPLPDNLGYYMLTVGYYLDEGDKPIFSTEVVPGTLVPEGSDAFDLALRKLKG